MTCLPMGMRCSSSTCVCWSLMTMQRLPRTLGPKSTMPSILEISAASLGRRASNSSATRGRPPVMSLVLEVLRGVFAMVVEDDDLRVQIFLVFDHDHRFLLGLFVEFLLHRNPFDDIVELHLAGFLGKNRHAVRIPLDERVALFDLAAVRNGDN